MRSNVIRSGSCRPARMRSTTSGASRVSLDETPLAAEFPNTEGIKDLWMRARWIDVGVDGVVPLAPSFPGLLVAPTLEEVDAVWID
jgi:hypothetical protein